MSMIPELALIVVLAAPAVGVDDSQPALVDVAEAVPDLRVDLKYADTDNFTGRQLYPDGSKCLLHPEAAQMLADAAAYLKHQRPDLRLLAYDCGRPRSVQIKMWKAVKGTPRQAYVANPHAGVGSLHSYGCAVDLTLADEQGRALDMGTPFDHFGPKAHVSRELDLLARGRLSHEHVANRALLRSIMVRAGFHPLAREWWHFSCATRAKARTRYSIIK
jgi:D-alanyl-D-alanine dipeptidase